MFRDCYYFVVATFDKVRQLASIFTHFSYNSIMKLQVKKCRFFQQSFRSRLRNLREKILLGNPLDGRIMLKWILNKVVERARA